jgi:hypothetical protein
MDSPRLLLPFSFNVFSNISDKANIDCIPHQRRNQETDTIYSQPTSPTTSRITSNHVSWKIPPWTRRIGRTGITHKSPR